MVGQHKFSFNEPEVIQNIASNPKYSVYLSASAGTGKTKVLTDRYLRLLLDGTEPNKILCLTFTNAAAAEMKSRITSRLQKWSICNEQELIPDIKKLINKNVNHLNIAKAKGLYSSFIEKTENIRIQTIHSFCSDILKKYSNYEYPYYSYEIIEEGKKKELFKEAFGEALIEKSGITSNWVNKLIEFYDIERLDELVSSLLNSRIRLLKFLSQFDTEGELIEGIYQLHSITPQLTFDTHLKNELIDLDTSYLSNMAKALLEYDEPLASNIFNWLNLDLAAKIKSFNDYKNIFLKSDGEAKARIVKKKLHDINPDLANMILAEQERIKVLDQYYKRYFSAELCLSLVMLTKGVLAKLEEKKKKLQLFEYDDLILKTIELLTNSESSSWILYKLDIILDHILVDEAQDLSEIQWEIIKLISDEFFAGIGTKEYDRTVFIVGDFKQSIYGFQGAEPKEFEIAKDFFATKAEGALKHWHQLNMSISFRSTEPILKHIDHVFSKIFLGIEEEPKHVAYRSGGGHIEVWPLIERASQNETRNWQVPEYNDSVHDPKKQLAIKIADTISMWIHKKRLLYGHLRLIEPKDIMILLRKRSEFIDYLIAELRKREISVADYEKSSFHSSLITKDLLSLIKFINLQSDDYNLACLLKSPIIGISEEQLFNLSFRREDSLWNELKKKELTIYNYLATLLEESKQKSLYQLIYKILYYDDKYYNFMQRFAEKAKIVIDQFIFSIIAFESSRINFNPYEEFFEWFENYNSKMANFSLENQVKILTVHGAKGLQAPIVFLADSASSDQSPHENLFWDHRGNLFFSSYSEFDSSEIKAVKEYNKLKQKEENYRLLYVALTRAEDELYICGWNNNRVRDSWYDLLSKLPFSSSLEPQFYDSYITHQSSDSYTEINTSNTIKLIKRKNITPSHIKKNKVHATFMKRGIVIHKLLHDLPQLAKHEWKRILDQYELNIVQEVTKTIDKFPDIFFAEQAMSEFPIIGIIDKQQVNAQIDKIIFRSDVIEIIDFKTDTEPNVKLAQEAYAFQLEMYKKLLGERFHNIKINAYILFTANQELIKILN